MAVEALMCYLSRVLLLITGRELPALTQSSSPEGLPPMSLGHGILAH